MAVVFNLYLMMITLDGCMVIFQYEIGMELVGISVIG